MKLTLVEQTCKQCGTKLTYFEFTEKSNYCMGCYKEENRMERYPFQKKPSRLRNKRLFVV